MTFSLVFGVFFFFKQKTAYEMRISDWSSDVCSSDLHFASHHVHPFLDAEHGRLGGIGRDADHQPVDQVRAAPDDVHMAERDRIEGSGINAGACHNFPQNRSEEHTSELQSLMRISYAVFCLKKKIKNRQQTFKSQIK